MKDKILTEAKRLFDSGFAILWLGKESKRPIESNWTTGPRKSWSDLARAYKPGYNYGVRLGHASDLGGGIYLDVIDCDVKSTDPKHAREMQKTLREIFAKEFIDSTALSRSGRGNGSCHYFIASESPSKGKLYARSQDAIKVRMPSAQTPSAKDKAVLSTQELKAGFRIRPAWEISVLGEGRQVVLPGSIHPDTKREYVWERKYESSLDVRLMAASAPIEEKKEVSKAEVKWVDFDETMKKLPLSVRMLITEGADCDDRSAGLFKAAIAMVRAGLSDDEILTVLTEEDTYLGAAAYEHTKSSSRDTAANWVRKYTLTKARAEFDAANDFEAIVGIEDEPELLSDEEAELQLSQLLVKDWKKQIARVNGDSAAPPKSSLKNVVLILGGEFGKELFVKNEFSGLQLYGRDTPWGAKAGEEIRDEHVALIQHWFTSRYRFEPNDDKINKAITVLAANNAVHPVRDYLDSLPEWDGVSRCDTWLIRLLNAVGPNAYVRSVSRKVLVAMVKRIYEPGCKFDHVLILEGGQGIGKSRTIRALAGEDWGGNAPADLSNKDAVLSMRAKWILELGELSSLARSEVNQLKDFMSTETDRIRVPYGKRMESFPRQCIFIGTTNNDEYLRDTTGNRRYWPVKVGYCDVEAVMRERDQLFSEAKILYALGEPLWLDDEDARKESEIEQADRVFQDGWVDLLREYFEREFKKPYGERSLRLDKFKAKDLFVTGGDEMSASPIFATERFDTKAQMRVADCLRLIGCKKAKIRGQRVWSYEGHQGQLRGIRDAPLEKEKPKPKKALSSSRGN